MKGSALQLINRPVFRYSSVVFAIAIGFANFVACGAKMYQISLENDMGGTGSEDYKQGAGILKWSSLPGIHTPGGWGRQGLPIPFQFSHEISEDLQQSILQAMKTWEATVGQTVV